MIILIARLLEQLRERQLAIVEDVAVREEAVLVAVLAREDAARLGPHSEFVT